MNRLTTIALSALLGLAVFSATASADVKKGQKIYLKKLKAKCGFTGAKFAHKHTQDEWENLKESGKFGAEVTNICPKATIKPKYENDVYD
ncbi:MAG: cytochrome C, partial [Sulfurovum sp.]|nr:cytochrome C [Sulfurovum sp.]